MSKSEVDQKFGQTRVFDLDDGEVNPKVKEYLQHVRSEALFLTAIHEEQANNLAKEETDIENEHVARELPDHIDDFLDRLPLIQMWYDEKRMELETSLEENTNSSGEDAEEDSTEPTIDYGFILLSKLNCYFKNQKYRPWLDRIQPLIEAEILEREDVSQELELDEQWAHLFVVDLLGNSFTTYKEIEKHLADFQERQTKEPESFKEWVEHIESSNYDDVEHSMPLDIKIGLLVYISKNHLNKNYARAIERILVGLPEKLTSNQISVLRDLGKLSALYLYKIEAMHTSKTFKQIVVEDENSGIIPFNVAELILTVLSEKYGQKDLISW